jgi:hypothetical protein
VKDAKTDEAFFSKKTWKAYKSLMGYVRIGCISDHPDFHYYSYNKSVKLMCARGTSSLEGYHSHLRRIIQQFHSSPELCIKILSQFNYRWNCDRLYDRGFSPENFAGFYRHYLTEEIQEKCASKTDEPVHPEWESSKDVASRGEKFYIMEVQQSQEQYVPEGQEEDDDPDPTVIGTESELTPYQPFTGPYECHLFQENLQRHFKKSHEASEDRRSLATPYDMPRFAKWWEEQVKANELLDIDERKCLFWKTAAMLQDHYLKSKRYANAVATVNQVSTQGTSSVMDQCESLRARFCNAGVGEQYSEVSNAQPP